MTKGVLWFIALAAAGGCEGRVRIEDAVTPGAGGSASASSATTASPSSTSAGPSSGSGGSPSAWWEAPAAETLRCGRHTATPTAPGQVLIVGACALGDAGEPVNAVLYDDVSRSFEVIALEEARTSHGAARLGDGRVALVGDAPHVEYFDPSTHTTALGPLLIVPRTEPMLIPLPDGHLWVLGGFVSGEPISSGEIVNPSGGPSVLGAPLAHARARGAALLGNGGGAWIAGGEGSNAPNTGTMSLGGTEEAACPACSFADGPSLVALTGDASAVRSGGDVAVFGAYSLAWGDGVSFAPAIAHDGTTLVWPAATVTDTGRFFAAGIALYVGETRVLEATPGEGGHVIATRPDGDSPSITALGGSTILVVSGEAMLLHVAPN